MRGRCQTQTKVVIAVAMTILALSVSLDAGRTCLRDPNVEQDRNHSDVDGGKNAKLGGAGSYEYAFKQISGPLDWVKLDGKEVSIQFAEDSNREAISALAALSWRIKSHSNNKITIMGELIEEPDQAGECSYKFKLSGWQIRAPFFKIAGYEGSQAGSAG